MPNVCPHCNQTIRTPKPKLVPNADPSTMTDAELFAHFKRTDRLETLKFWIRIAEDRYPAIWNGLTTLYLASLNVTIQPKAFDRQFEALKGMWRRESNARELQALITAGATYDRELSRWELPEVDDSAEVAS